MTAAAFPRCIAIPNLCIRNDLVHSFLGSWSYLGRWRIQWLRGPNGFVNQWLDGERHKVLILIYQGLVFFTFLLALPSARINFIPSTIFPSSLAKPGGFNFDGTSADASARMMKKFNFEWLAWWSALFLHFRPWWPFLLPAKWGVGRTFHIWKLYTFRVIHDLKSFTLQ